MISEKIARSSILISHVEPHHELEVGPTLVSHLKSSLPWHHLHIDPFFEEQLTGTSSFHYETTRPGARILTLVAL